MAFNRDFNQSGGGRGFAPRQMFQGNWKCAECGAEITELPFKPAEDRPIYCRDCHRNKQPKRFNRY